MRFAPLLLALFTLACDDGGKDTASADLDMDGYTTADGDCNDGNADINPAAQESCNGEDDDCDGEIDEEAADAYLLYPDADGDGYGDTEAETRSCEAMSGYIDIGEDCDDGNAAAFPGAAELDSGTACMEDGDSDGYGSDSPGASTAEAGTDCDDSDESINPEGEEICDGADNDCDGETDEDDAIYADIWYADNDGDGFGDASVYQTACDQPKGYVADNTDCDDALSEVNPEASEICDGVDNDCNDEIDEGDATDATTWYADSDGDGFGDPDDSAQACDALKGYTDNAEDCDDKSSAAASTWPGAAPLDSAKECLQDADGDGYGASEPEAKAAGAGSDCDDGDAQVNPEAIERCDELDNDCDGSVDEDDAEDAATWYADSDGDSFGDADSSAPGCSQPKGYVAGESDGVAFDCDDGDASINPAATELCDEIDNDCDDEIDEDDAADVSTWFADSDGDSFGALNVTTHACEQPEGYVADDTDCNDVDASINPDAIEVCDGVDNDCDGDSDEDDAMDALMWYIDGDSDGYGVADSSALACDQPSGYALAEAGEDCDDGAPLVFPGAIELCDGIDNDCDNDTDEDDAADAATWFADADGDSYGDPLSSTAACSQPTGYVAATADGSDTDCDDAEANANPGADEICDGIDNDCDSLTDEDDALDAATWYADTDSDGFGDAASSMPSCDQPIGYVSADTDCDDGDGAVNPAATEVCDGIDNDCDDETDEGDADDALTWYADSDGDGYGDASSSQTACTQPSSYVSDDSDCDDGNSDAQPGATELCNGDDNDCDGTADNDCFSVGDILVTEVMQNPSALSDEVGEWIEIYNQSADTIDLEGLVLRDDDNDLHVISGSLEITAGQYLVMARDALASSAADYVYADFVLGNRDDEVILATFGTDGSDGITIDGIAYDDGASFPDPTGYAMSLDQYALDASDNDDGSNWCEAWQVYDSGDYGTPGEENLSCYVDVTAVSPEEGLEAGGLEVTLTGSRLDTVSTVSFGGVAASFTALSATELVAVTPAQAYGWVDVTVSDGSDSSTLSSAFLYTGDSSDIDWCNVQWPDETVSEVGVASELLYGRVYMAGLTIYPWQGPGIDGQLGWGDVDSDPSSDPGWTWQDASYNTTYDSDDEYMGELTVEDEGYYAFAFRFSYDSGVTWLYCDYVDGSSASDPYDPAQQALLLVGSDDDGDGYLAEFDDCDDADSTVYEGAEELCDELDNDCDDAVDELQDGSLYLDGSNDYVFMGDDNLLDITGSITMEAWIYAEAPSGDEPVLAKMSSFTTSQYWFGVYNGGFGLMLGDASGWGLEARSSGAISADSWIHIASVWDGSAWYNYQDGVLADSGGYSAAMVTGNEPLTIGIDSSDDITRFQGYLADVRLWEVARSDAEILDNMYELSDTSGLVGWWKLDDLSGQDAIDSSDNGLDGRCGNSDSADNRDGTWSEEAPDC